MATRLRSEIPVFISVDPAARLPALPFCHLSLQEFPGTFFESHKALLRRPLSVSMCAATLISLSTSVQSFPRAVCLLPGQPKPAASPLCQHAAGPRPGEPLRKCFFFKIWVAKFVASFTLESRRRGSTRRHSAVRQWKKTLLLE